MIGHLETTLHHEIIREFFQKIWKAELHSLNIQESYVARYNHGSDYFPQLDFCRVPDIFTITNGILCTVSYCLCVFVKIISSHSIIFHPYGYVIITGEGLQIVPFKRQSWTLSSEGSLACYT